MYLYCKIYAAKSTKCLSAKNPYDRNDLVWTVFLAFRSKFDLSVIYAFKSYSNHETHVLFEYEYLLISAASKLCSRVY